MRLICALNNITSILAILESTRAVFRLAKWARKCLTLSGQELVFQGPSTSSKSSNEGVTLWGMKGSWRSSWDLFWSGLNFYHSALLWDILQPLMQGRCLHLKKKMSVEKNIVFENCRFSANLLKMKLSKIRNWSLLFKVHDAEIQALKMNLTVCQRSDQGVSYSRHKMPVRNSQPLNSLLRTGSK